MDRAFRGAADAHVTIQYNTDGPRLAADMLRDVMPLFLCAQVVRLGGKTLGKRRRSGGAEPAEPAEPKQALSGTHQFRTSPAHMCQSVMLECSCHPATQAQSCAAEPAAPHLHSSADVL